MFRFQPSPQIMTRLILIFMLLANTIACTGQKQPIKAPNATSVPTQGSSSSVDTSEQIVITFAGYEYERQLYEPLMAEFHQQNPEITVQFVALPENSSQTLGAFTDYPRRLASSADTTVISGFGSGTSAYFRNLTPMMEADAGYSPTNFWPAASDACQDADGNALGIPATVMLRGVYYDAQAFDKAGLQHPAPGWTWDDFRKDITALAKKDGDAIRYGFAERFDTILSP